VIVTGNTDATLRPRLAGAAVAGGLVVALWSALAQWWAPRVTPTVAAVARQVWNDRSFYLPHLRTTAAEAAWGYLIGNVAAIVVAALVVLVRPLSRLLERIGVAIYCLPLLALGPILQIVAPGSSAKIALAALSVFFTTMVCCVAGLRSADPASVDVVRAAGGGKQRAFSAVRVPAALPALFAGLRIAAPAALLGAIVGEYLGGRRGLGVAMIQSQSSFDVARTWGLAVVMGLTVGLVYAVTGVLARFLLPWAAGERPLAVLQLGAGRAGTASAAASIAVSAGVLVAGWWGLLRLYDLNPYFAKTPGDVWTFLTTGSDDRSVMWAAFGTTLVDTAVGFAIGLAAAVVVSAAAVAWSAVNWVVTPSAVAMRSIPIIAMTPLIALVFGRGLAAVTVIVGLVTFFPTFVALTTAMREAPAQACELITVYGGSAVRELVGVRLPFALPALFAACKVALPAALSGALLAEWLATGDGLGSLMLRATASSRFALVWSASTVIVAASVFAYGCVGAVESFVGRRLGTAATD
jgi:ABC-type nitrate/sulfonate/bicarbonate transport system permease component